MVESVSSPSTECITATLPENSPAMNIIGAITLHMWGQTCVEIYIPRDLAIKTLVKSLENPNSKVDMAMPNVPVSTIGFLPILSNML